MQPALRFGTRQRELPKGVERMALSWCDLAGLGALAQVSQSMKQLVVQQVLSRAHFVGGQVDKPVRVPSVQVEAISETKSHQPKEETAAAEQIAKKSDQKAEKTKEKEKEQENKKEKEKAGLFFLCCSLLALNLLSKTSGRLRHLHVDLGPNLKHMSHAFETRLRDVVAAVIEKHNATFESLTGNFIQESPCCFLHSRLARCPNLRSLTLIDSVGAKSAAVLQRVVQYRLALTELDLNAEVPESLLIELLPRCRLQKLSVCQMSPELVEALADTDCSQLRRLRITARSAYERKCQFALL